MTRRYEVVWAGVAEKDLGGIIDRIASERPNAARDILEKIKQSASDLQSSHERGRIVPELLDQGIHIYRELIIPPWRLIYRVSDHSVYILSLLDSRRDVEDILLNRLAYFSA